MNYGLEYYEKMLREYSATAKQICDVRWQFILVNIEHRNHQLRVLDYGCGCGWFRAWRPPGVDVWSYDIAKYPQTGVGLRMYDVVCFWDVLEHIKDFAEIEPILALTKYVAATVPIKPDDKSYLDWKHLKPYEHVHIFNEESLEALFIHYSFELVTKAQPECPPREDVMTFLFRKVGS